MRAEVINPLRMSMKQYKYCPNYAYAAMVFSTTAGSVLASGFDLPDQDAFAVGRGLAVTATADNPDHWFHGVSLAI